jgi:hypothetical protein
MEVINLATRENQELILSYFPIKGGTNFSEYQAFCVTQRIKNTDYTLVLDITGEGFLNLLLASGVLDARIIIDDTPEIRFSFGGVYCSAGLMLHFNTSLKVYLRLIGYPQTTETAYIVYSLKGE